MTREHLCKAKRLDNGEWVEGNLINDGVTGQAFIKNIGDSVNELDSIDRTGVLRFFAHEVISETVCEYTGLMGAEKEKIFEGDLAFNEYEEENGEIVFVEGCYYFETSGHITGLNEVNNDLCIIGNIHNESEDIPND